MPLGTSVYDAAELQGRNAGTANALSIVSPGLITDGLWFFYDAGNYFSYPLSGANLFDLSGNRLTASLVNGPTYSNDGGGSLVMSSASTQYASVVPNKTFTNITFLIWMKRNGNQANYAGLMYSRAASSGIDFRATSNQLGYDWGGGSQYYNFVSGLTVPDAAWSMGVLSINPSAGVFYLGQSTGISSATNSTSHGSISLTGSLGIGYDSSWGAFNGSVGMAMIYERYLSPVEIEQIFQSTRARFGV